jgi:hypothetical protein
MMDRLNWTTSHHGVSHLLGLLAGYQISLEERGELADVYLLALRGPHPFSPTRSFHGPINAAKHTAEEWAVALRDEHTDQE